MLEAIIEQISSSLLPLDERLTKHVIQATHLWNFAGSLSDAINQGKLQFGNGGLALKGEHFRVSLGTAVSLRQVLNLPAATFNFQSAWWQNLKSIKKLLLSPKFDSSCQ